MKKILAIFGVIFITGCSSPQFESEGTLPADTTNMTIVEDNATRDVFLNVMTTYCLDEGKSCDIVADRSKHNPEEITLNYISFWKWDVTTFIHDAKIKAYQHNKKIAEVSFYAPSNLNFNKFGNDQKRIEMMMKVLLSDITAEEANKELSAGRL